MKPAPFVYFRPETVDEAVSLLSEHGDEGKILAGGQSLIPMMNLRLAQPSALIDVCAIGDLNGVRSNGELCVGATARQADVLESAAVGATLPIVPAALQLVGHTANRNRGTFGGSMAHADAAAELPAVLLAVGGSVVARGPGGERVIAADDFFESYLTTALAEDELLCEVRLPKPAPDGLWGFMEMARRHGDFAMAGVAFTAELDNGTIRSARIALLGVADRAVRATAAEEALAGQALPDPAASRDIGALAARDLDPPYDQHGSSQYRKDLAAVLVGRVIDQAVARRSSR